MALEHVFNDYDAVLAKLESIAAESAAESISSTTIANVRDLIAVCRATAVPVPDLVGRGYYPTICLQWGFLQVEVFDDRLEVYHLKETQTSIWYEEHHPGAAFSRKFLDELSALVS